jgi:molybdate transport system regulatory protein
VRHLRVLLAPGRPLGPGQVDLLQHIREAGSIAAAGRRMGMSYRRAWHLVASLNGLFQEPVVETQRGGPGHGGARLTHLGDQVLATFRRMERQAEKALAKDLARLRALIRDDLREPPAP